MREKRTTGCGQHLRGHATWAAGLNRHQVGGVSRSPDGLFAQQEREPIRGRPAVRGKSTYGGRPGQRVEEQGTWASQKHTHYGRPVDRGVWTAKTVKRPRQQPAHPQYANYWALLTRKRHTMPHSAQPQHTYYRAPRMRKRHQREHWPQRPTESSDPTRPTESSDPTQHAEGRTGECPGPRKGATTRWNVTHGGVDSSPTPASSLVDVFHRISVDMTSVRLPARPPGQPLDGSSLPPPPPPQPQATAGIREGATDAGAAGLAEGPPHEATNDNPALPWPCRRRGWGGVQEGGSVLLFAAPMRRARVLHASHAGGTGGVWHCFSHHYEGHPAPGRASMVRGRAQLALGEVPLRQGTLFGATVQDTSPSWDSKGGAPRDVGWRRHPLGVPIAQGRVTGGLKGRIPDLGGPVLPLPGRHRG